MATTEFNTIVRNVARRLQEAQADAAGYLSGTFDTYSAALVAQYVNRAVSDLVLKKTEKLQDRVADVLPEMVRTSGALTLATGRVARPVDCLFVLGGVTSPGNVYLTPLRGAQVSVAIARVDAKLKPSACEPMLYDEGGYLNTLGITSGDIVVRYVVKHQPITISEAAAGNGKWLTGADGAYTASTKRLAGTFSTVLAAGDAGKQVMLRTATKVYHATIASVVSGTIAVLAGTDVPAADVAAGSVVAVLVSDLSPETTDLQLGAQWFTEIEDSAVRRAIADAQRGLLLAGDKVAE